MTHMNMVLESGLRDEPRVMGAGDLLSVLRHYWILVLGLTLLGCLVAGVLAVTLTKVYRAEILLRPTGLDARQSQLGALVSQLGSVGSLLGPGFGESGTAAEYMTVLQSPQFLMDFIARHELMPELFAEEWEQARKAWKPDLKRTPSLEDGYQLLMTRVLAVEQERDTGIIRVTVDWRDPKLAAGWANRLVADLNELARKRAIAEAEASIDYLDRQLKSSQVLEVQQSVYRLLEGQLNTVMLANGRLEYAFRVLSAAYAPEPHRYVRPRPALMIVLGAMLGGICALSVALLLHSRRRAQVARV
jgi:uncharacterized protein involved in exopolysaccharide biosynthesis